MAFNSIAVAICGLHVQFGREPATDQPDQLLASVEAPLLAGAQPLDQPRHPVWVTRGSGQPDHEVLEPFRYPALVLRLMRHRSSLISRSSTASPDPSRCDFRLVCPHSSTGLATRRQGERQVVV